jgi:hypothetical protein
MLIFYMNAVVLFYHKDKTLRFYMNNPAIKLLSVGLRL